MQVTAENPQSSGVMVMREVCMDLGAYPVLTIARLPGWPMGVGRGRRIRQPLLPDWRQLRERS